MQNVPDSQMQHNIGKLKIGPATHAQPQIPSNQHHHHPHHLQTPAPSAEQISDDSTFNVLQFNANGIGNKLTELGVVLERNKVKVVVIQESKLSSKSKNPCIQNYITVRKDRPHGHDVGLLIFIHELMITFSKQPCCCCCSPFSPCSFQSGSLASRSLSSRTAPVGLLHKSDGISVVG